MKNNHISNEDMQRMQQDAIKRAQEMQSRAKIPFESKPGSNFQENDSPQKNNSQRFKPQDSPIEHDYDNETKKSKPGSSKKGPAEGITDILDNIIKDNDKTLILVLLLILVDEKADTGLILALMYLMM